MKRILISIFILVFILCSGGVGYAFMTGEEAHTKMIYPIVRVSHGNTGGSGTLIYSKVGEKKYSTYVLTNHHVISSAINIADEWDSDLAKEIKKEKRDTVYVEIFKYRDLSTPIGTLKVEAEIVLYNADEDMALIKLRMEDKSEYVAKLAKKNDELFVMDETVAVGCSLGYPPLPTIGVVTRLNFQIQSFPYHMSSSQIIYGNSGGAMFHEGKLIGIPSRVAVVGWASVVPHMGLFIPISRVYDWMDKEHYTFLYDDTKTEKEGIEEREKEIKAKKEAKK